MAALDFPASPTVGTIYTANGRSWKWDGTAWVSANLITSIGVTGSTMTIYGSPIAYPDATTESYSNSVAISAASTRTLTLNGGGGSNGLVLNSSNNVGIGTASPACPLDTNGFIRALSKAASYPASGKGLEIYYESGADAAYLLSYDRGASAYKPLVYAASTHAFNIGTTANALSINSTGVGIGSTPSVYTLYVTGNTQTSGGIFVQTNSTANASPVVRIQGQRSDTNTSQVFGGTTVLERYSTSAAIGTGQPLGNIIFGGNYTGSTMGYTASISAVASSNWSSTSTANTDLVFYTGSTANALGLANTVYGTERLRIDSSGNLGLGVTPSAWASGVKAIDQNTIGSLATSSLSVILSNNAYSNGTNWIYKTSTTAAQYQQLAGQHQFFTAASGTAGNAITFTQAMTLDASGNLLVGQTSGTSKLSVTQATAGATTCFLTGVASLFNFDYAGSGTSYFDGAGIIYRTFAGVTCGSITNGTNSIWKITSSTGYADMAVNSATGNLAYYDFQVNSAAVARLSADASGLYFATGSGNTTRMTVDSSGNAYIETGTFWQYAPAPASITTTATLTAANLQADIINTTGTTYTVTMPTGTAIDAGFTGVPTTNIGFDFHIVNTASGTITMAVNTGVTSLGALTVATATSAHFRLRRTAANTYVMYRLS